MNIVAHNLLAMNSNRMLGITENKRSKATEKLSSGYKVNRAADDAAGLAISEKMRRQIRGLNQGGENIQDGISLIQVADGVLGEVQDMLHRMTELSIQSANGTNDSTDRAALQKEIAQISNELDRIGHETTFNGMPLFDDMYGEDLDGSITKLVSSPAADTGHLTEATKIGSKWYPSASIDFSNINSNNIDKLNGQGFKFYCSMSCDEVFDFTFTTDGTPSSAKNLAGNVTHRYSVDISGCTSGKEVIDTMFNYVKAHAPYNNGAPATSLIPGALAVSHSNEMTKSDDGNSIIIYSNWNGSTSEASAKLKFANASGNSGRIDTSELTKIIEDEKINEIPIQRSGNPDDVEMISTHRMNASILGIDTVSVATISSASTAITTIKNAHNKISSQRSELGACQNRLEHSYNINKNVEENTTAAESQIRDTDMTTEMVEYSNNNILSQAGTSMLSQANQNQQQILSLLQ